MIIFGANGEPDGARPAQFFKSSLMLAGRAPVEAFVNLLIL